MTIYEKLLTQKEITEVAYQTLTIEYNGLATPLVLPFKDFLVRDSQFEYNGTVPVKFLIDQNVVLMQFCVEGQCSCTSNTCKKPVSFTNGECNIVYLPKGEYSIDGSFEEATLLSIYLNEDFFFKHIQENHSAFGDANLFTTVFSRNIAINHKLRTVLNEISNCEFDGHLKMLYLKAKIIESLTLQFVQYEEEKTVGIKKEDIEKMMMVKNLIEQNINEVYSLSYLARIVGTNEQYLKKNFKTLFGNTVFGYMLACKMEKAKELLSTGKHQITEVSATVGYKHATHFTTAFKKFFGYLPSLVKRNVLSGVCIWLNLRAELFEVLAVV